MKGTKGLNNVRAKGELTVIHIGKDGEELANDIYKNLVVTTGKNTGIQQIIGPAGGGAQPAKFNYVGIGTDNTAPVVGDNNTAAAGVQGANAAPVTWEEESVY